MLASGRMRSVSSLAAMRDVLEGELSSIRDAGTWKSERIITSKQDAVIKVQGSQGPILNFCANNYLGLSVSYLYYQFRE